MPRKLKITPWVAIGLLAATPPIIMVGYWAAISCAEAGYTIRVNSVHPGGIHTELTEKEAQDLGLPLEQYLSPMEVI